MVEAPRVRSRATATLKDATLDLSRRGDVVLDPFLGSGSTRLAAESVDRVCRGIELDSLYIDVIIRRFEKRPAQSWRSKRPASLSHT